MAHKFRVTRAGKSREKELDMHNSLALLPAATNSRGAKRVN